MKLAYTLQSEGHCYILRKKLKHCIYELGVSCKADYLEILLDYSPVLSLLSL